MNVFRLLLRLAAPALAVVGIAVAVPGCDIVNSSRDGGRFTTDNCTIPTNRLVSGCRGGADCIPSIDGVAPGSDRLVDAEIAGALGDSARVIGIVREGQALAIPLPVLWTHEIVNVDDWGGRTFAATHCPLTGSSLAFDRRGIDGAEFGVSGLLFNNNLVMYDRRDERSLWPQMSRKATCGARVGTALSRVPLIEMTWGRWRTLHPDTRVVTDGRGFDRTYPYGNYRAPNTGPLRSMPVDDRRPPKERVLGLPGGEDGSVAVPFGELDDGGAARVITVAAGGTQKTVFWSRAAEAARAFETSSTFSVQDGRIVDDATGSVWSVEGRAIEGERAGDQLDVVASSYVAFWFAWAAFQPQTTIWTDA
jgi:hypothetical protein